MDILVPCKDSASGVGVGYLASDTDIVFYPICPTCKVSRILYVDSTGPEMSCDEDTSGCGDKFLEFPGIPSSDLFWSGKLSQVKIVQLNAFEMPGLSDILEDISVWVEKWTLLPVLRLEIEP